MTESLCRTAAFAATLVFGLSAAHAQITSVATAGTRPAPNALAIPQLDLPQPVFHPREFAFPTGAWIPGGLSESTPSPANPWLDFRLVAWMLSPSGRIIAIPGFYAADGDGGDSGSVWKIRVSPDEIGTWLVLLQFEWTPGLNVQPATTPGIPIAPHGMLFSFDAGLPDLQSPGFLRRGPLEATDHGYLRHRDGTWFLKGGTNSPENLFGYVGFDHARDEGGLPRGTRFLHGYASHVADWRPGDPNWAANGDPNAGKGIIGALNYLASEGVNSIWFLPMNLGGDACDTYPFLDPSGTGFDKVTHYDVGRLEQWNTVIQHAQELGILVELVLAEEETANVQWLGNGMTAQRRLFLKTLAAMFGHHLGLRWVLCEENSPEPTDEFTVADLSAMAEWLNAHTTFEHPITVHSDPDDLVLFDQILGSGTGRWLRAAALQVTRDYNPTTEAARAMFVRHGREGTVSIDEPGPASTGLTATNTDDRRKNVLWDVYLSGGDVAWYFGYHLLPLGGDVDVEDFRTRAAMWRQMRYARQLLEELPFWQMRPADDLVNGETRDATYGDAEVFAEPGQVYVVYYANASTTGSLDLRAAGSGANFRARWYDPRNGVWVGGTTNLGGGGVRALPAAPSPASQDWVLVVVRA